MAAIQLNFTLRTNPKCKTVHLVGSWDNYGGQIPLNKDTAKAGGWKGTFRFQGGQLRQGQRYWYYYIIDGYHASHDPARDSTKEPTTGRMLNILDIPSGHPTSTPYARGPDPATITHHRHSRRVSDVPKGRALSPSQIQSPLPSKPYATRTITSGTYDARAIEALNARYAAQRISSPGSDSDDSDVSERSETSDRSSDVPSLSSRSSNTSSPSSVSSAGCCTCERYAITRSGGRVKLDCGGARCGYSDASSECSSDSDGGARGKSGAKGGKGYKPQTTRRQGIVVRR